MRRGCALTFRKIFLPLISHPIFSNGGCAIFSKRAWSSRSCGGTSNSGSLTTCGARSPRSSTSRGTSSSTSCGTSNSSSTSCGTRSSSSTSRGTRGSSSNSRVTRSSSDSGTRSSSSTGRGQGIQRAQPAAGQAQQGEVVVK